MHDQGGWLWLLIDVVMKAGRFFIAEAALSMTELSQPDLWRSMVS